MNTHQLSSTLLITGNPATEPAEYLKKLIQALKNGIRLVQIRAKSLNQQQYQRLAAAAVELCHRHGARAMLSQHTELIDKIPADGIHLPSADLMKLLARPVAKNLLFSASCHNSIQLQQAITVDADFVVISPIFATPSSPTGHPLGWDKFASLVKGATIPVYTLGGLGPTDIPHAQAQGAIGIAAIRSLWEPTYNL